MGEMIYIWGGAPESFPADDIGTYHPQNSLTYFRLLTGNLLGSGERPRICFDCKVDHLGGFDCLPHSARIPLVSDSLACAMKEKVKDDVQLVPAVVECEDGVILDYFLLNVLRVAEIIDLIGSEFVPFPGSKAPMSFSKVAFHEEISRTFMIARDVNCESSVFLTQEMVDFLKAKCRKTPAFYLAEEFLC